MFIVFGLLYFIVGFIAVTYTEWPKARYKNAVAKLYLAVTIVLLSCLFYNYLYKPIKHELPTKAIIVESYWNSSKYWGWKCIYTVKGKEYKGDISRGSCFSIGDTVDIVYDSVNPADMLATYKLYWYINTDKKKYWDTYNDKCGTQKTGK